MLGKPGIRGTRILVELIHQKLSEGVTEMYLNDAYPRLVKEDIQAALACAARSLAYETSCFMGIDGLYAAISGRENCDFAQV